MLKIEPSLYECWVNALPILQLYPYTIRYFEFFCNSSLLFLGLDFVMIVPCYKVKRLDILFGEEFRNNPSHFFCFSGLWYPFCGHSAFILFFLVHAKDICKFPMETSCAHHLGSFKVCIDMTYVILG